MVLLSVALVSYGVTLSSEPEIVFPQGLAAGAPYHSMTHSAAPVRLLVPSKGIDAPVVDISVTNSVLEPPADFHEVGWWDQSAKVGASSGQTVITGHTVHTGGGSMNNLPKVRVGDAIDIVTPQGKMRYVAERVQVLSKDDVAKRAHELFGQDRGNGRLVLITCTNWNGIFYPDNVVVFGKPLGIPTTDKNQREAQSKLTTSR
ncbi:MAG: Sortase family protein [Marmoricola sp.]|nr:Sortase family protein [Marmoricola sp.]